MAKTKNAFALRDFDAERILQRNFFLQRLGIIFENTDIETLEIYYSVADTSEKGAKAMEQKLTELCNVGQAVWNYKERLTNHLNKLGDYVTRYAVEFTKTNDDNAKRKYARADGLAEKYTKFRRACEQLFEKCQSLISEGEKAIQQQYKIEFATSLKRLRQEKKMTQRDLAGRLGISVPSLSQFESAKIEPTLKTLARLANILETTTDAILGRAV